MTHARAKDFEIRDVPPAEAKAFIRKYHYSKGCSNTSVYRHGLYCRHTGVLKGVAMWMPPTRVAAESVNREAWTRVLALTRLAIHPDVATNGASLLLGGSIRKIRDGEKWVSLVTYADEFMQHSGAIYRATNWTYVGRMSANPRWEDAEGRQVSRLSTKSRTNAQMIALGYRMVGSFAKHKFIMHLKPKRRRASIF